MQKDQWKLKSGRFVEDVIKACVQSLDFEHPSMYCILDMKDENWSPLFSDDEKAEINQVTDTAIQYPPLPTEMEAFLTSIPKTTDLNEIYNYLESRTIDINKEAPLIYLKFCLQSAILLLKANYFQRVKKERDMCSNVWHFISKAFDGSILECDIEQASSASKESNCKKRKMSATAMMERQESPLIPDMKISQGEQEYAIIEASRSSNDTKQINEEGKKCPILMSHIFDQLLTVESAATNNVPSKSMAATCLGWISLL